jgi:Sortase and related acyltransferases
MRVERCTGETLEDWVELRHALWPDADIATLRAEAEDSLADSGRTVAFVVRDAASSVGGGVRGGVLGFAEASLRRDYVNGCETSPVAFLEGIYVRADQRKRGVARLLVRAVEDWATSVGCSELASDADIRNDASHRMHGALGFEETERVVYFRKLLDRG